MRYSDDIIEEVRMKNDIVDVVSQYVKLNKRGSTYFGLCPFHNEKTPSFSVTPAKQMYYCFGCGAGGNVFNFVMEYENYTFGEALKHLADRAGVQLPKIEYSGEANARPRCGSRRNSRSPTPRPAAGCGYTPGWGWRPGDTEAPAPWGACRSSCRPPAAHSCPGR